MNWKQSSSRRDNSKIIWSAALIIIVWRAFTPSHASAQEIELDFLQGLRDRGYQDYALLYLDRLEASATTPAEVKTVIPLERAMTLLENARSLTSPDAQSKQLDAALANLERFVKDNPNHARAAEANTERGRILIGKAQVFIWKSKSPSNEDTKGTLQTAARKLVSQAKEIFQKAHDQYEQLFNSFPTFIPDDERQRREARRVAEGLYMSAQLDLANTKYELAQTYDRGSDKFKELLDEASIAYEAIHARYRSQYAGLFARTMQGKCFEEQDDIRKALGIYDELLSHNAQSVELRKLQEQVLQFRLICLNHETRKDYQLAIDEASNWLKDARSRARTQVGLGIRWELTRAQEFISQKRTIDEADKNRILRQALANAREINRYPGPYQDVSYSMIQRLLVALDRDPGDPEDFDTAFGLANTMLEDISNLRKKLEQAKAKQDQSEVANLEEELDALLAETERMWRLALSLATDETDLQQLNLARYRYAVVLYYHDKAYETAVVGEFLANHFRTTQASVALDGAYLALAGYLKNYNATPKDQREAKLDSILRVYRQIAQGWPNSDKANDARMDVGATLKRAGRTAQAGEIFAEVPPSSDRYGTSQLDAGQAYWEAYLSALAREERTDTDTLKQWHDAAQAHLEAGIAQRHKEVPESQPTPDKLAGAKASLAQLHILNGEEQKAIDLLTQAPHSVIKAIEVADESKRPTSGGSVKTRQFAGFVLRQLLRAYVGTKNLEKARETRTQLEKVAGSEGGEELTQIYVQLGKELEEELERLKKLDDTQRLAEVREAFEAFLEDTFNRKEGQNYTSLIWIGETYFGLALGSMDNPSQASGYFAKASQAYNTILERAQQDSKFVDAARLPGVKVRLVTCKRREGEYQAALDLVSSVLADRSKDLDTQMEAARVYQDWGMSDALENDKLATAITGTKVGNATIWGWAQLATRLQLFLQAGKKNPAYEEKLYEARYNIALCRYHHATNSNDQKERDTELEKAELELVAFVRISPDLPETDWWNKYDQVYQDILLGLGRTPIALQKPKPFVAQPVVATTNATKVSQRTQGGAGSKTDDAEEGANESSGMMGMLIFVALLLAGGGVIFYVVQSSGGKRKRRVVAPATPAPTKVKSKTKKPGGGAKQKTRPKS